MLNVDPSHVDERVRQILRRLSELEEKYSMRSSKLIGEQHIIAALATKSDEARREVELWKSLYSELARLEELRSSYRREQQK